MTNTLTIFKRELRSYFNSPVAYIVIVLFLVATGIAFASTIFIIDSADLRVIFGTISGWIEYISPPFLLMVFAPAITMHLLAEERRMGTMEILVTLPITDQEIVVGKYLAAFVLTAVTVVLTAASWLTIASLGNADNGATFAGYIGLLLTAAVYVAIGIFASALTKSQIIAFLLAIVISLAFYAIQFFMPILPPSLATFFEFSSIDYHLQNMSRGVLDSRDIIYYLSMIFLFLYLAIKAIESRKWRSA